MNHSSNDLTPLIPYHSPFSFSQEDISSRRVGSKLIIEILWFPSWTFHEKQCFSSKIWKSKHFVFVHWDVFLCSVRFSYLFRQTNYMLIIKYKTYTELLYNNRRLAKLREPRRDQGAYKIWAPWSQRNQQYLVNNDGLWKRIKWGQWLQGSFDWLTDSVVSTKANRDTADGHLELICIIITMP